MPLLPLPLGRRRWPFCLLLLAAPLVACGPALVAVGTSVAVDGLREGTASAARGGAPSPAAAAAIGAGAALMVTGYQLTPPDQRQVATPPLMFVPNASIPPAPNAPPLPGTPRLP
jgi:hypothetical protein